MQTAARPEGKCVSPVFAEFGEHYRFLPAFGVFGDICLPKPGPLGVRFPRNGFGRATFGIFGMLVVLPSRTTEAFGNNAVELATGATFPAGFYACLDFASAHCAFTTGAVHVGY
ncbi:MAG: hypothetical protein WD795_05155 [Woeseia sp.]